MLKLDPRFLGDDEWLKSLNGKKNKLVTLPVIPAKAGIHKALG